MIGGLDEPGGWSDTVHDFDVRVVRQVYPKRSSTDVEKLPMRARDLGAVEVTLLKALATQREPVTLYALAAWHMPRDGLVDDLIALVDAVGRLHADGYVCADGDYVFLDDDQAAALRLIVGGGLNPAYEYVLRTLFLRGDDLGRPLSATEVAGGGVALYDLVDRRLQGFMTEKSPAYVAGILLRQLVELGYICRDMNNHYFLNAGQRAILAHRFPHWRDLACPAGQDGQDDTFRGGRAVELG